MNSPAADRIRFVLVEPSHPGNIGAAARAIRTMGFGRLAVVAPREPGFRHHEEALAFATHAAGVLQAASVHERLAQALEGVRLSFAMTGYAREFGPPLTDLHTAAARAHAHLAGEPGDVAFVFGGERNGLANDDVERCSVCCAIAADAQAASLNLAQAVQVAAYECRLAIFGGGIDPRLTPFGAEPPASHDRPRADAAFRAALAQLSAVPDSGDWRSDFGSRLRDAAAVLALAAEAGSSAVDLPALAGRIAEWREVQTHTSTQENAWLLLAAHALDQGAPRPRLTVDGVDQDGALYRRVDGASLAEGGVRLVNRGDRPVDLVVTATGVPLTPPAAGGNGYRIERAYYDLEGRRADPTRVTQGERLVTLLTIGSDTRRAARLILSDPLPAGFEIDNPNLVRAGDVAAIPWLGLVEDTAHRAFHADRLVAAIDRGEGDEAQMQLAYVVRAVSPGVFTHPAATVEDMYRPERRAWTDEARVEVVAPGP